MSDTTSTTNGTTEKATALTSVSSIEDIDPGPYRPDASTARVYDPVAESLSRIVVQASYETATFVNLANIYDRDADPVVRMGHLVDATECLELALTHLGQLRTAMQHRLRVIGDDWDRTLPF